MPPTCTQQSQVSMQLNVSKHTEHTPNLILSTHPESICMANLKIMPNTDTTSAMQTEPKQQCIARNYSEMNKKEMGIVITMAIAANCRQCAVNDTVLMSTNVPRRSNEKIHCNTRLHGQDSVHSQLLSSSSSGTSTTTGAAGACIES